MKLTMVIQNKNSSSQVRTTIFSSPHPAHFTQSYAFGPSCLKAPAWSI